MQHIVKATIKNPVLKRVGYYMYSFLCKLPLSDKFSLMFTDFEGFRYHGTFHDLWRFVGPFEPLTYKFLVENARECDVFLDVGAHIGIYTIRLAQRVLKVIALEPEPRNYNFLLKNIAINGVKNKVIALPIVASDKDGYADLCVKKVLEHTLSKIKEIA